MEIRYPLNSTVTPSDGSVTAAKIGAGAVIGPKLATTSTKILCATGRNGAGSMTLTGAVTSDTLCSVTNLTDGGANITDDFSTLGTGTLTQTSSTDYSAKNYKLSGSSSYKGWGPLGRSPGADTDVVGWSTSGVNSAGATLNSYLKAGPIRRVIPGQTGVAFRYTAPTVAACTTTMSTKPDLSSPIINALGDGGGDLDRFQVDVNGLSTNTRYYWRITCGDSTYREGIVTTLP